MAVSHTSDSAALVGEPSQDTAPDLLRDLVSTLVRQLMTAAGRHRLRCRVQRAQPGPGEFLQRPPAARVEQPGRRDRAGCPEAAVGSFLPGLDAQPAAPRESGPDQRDGDELPAWASTRRVDKLVDALMVDGISM
jgi:hypothetical protein